MTLICCAGARVYLDPFRIVCDHHGAIQPETEPSVFVRCSSHRARERLIRLIGKGPQQSYFRWEDTASRGIYLIPTSLLAEARQISGITKLRKTDGVRRCWGSGASPPD